MLNVLYRDAYTLMTNEKYDQALTKFNAVLNRLPIVDRKHNIAVYRCIAKCILETKPVSEVISFIQFL